MDEPPISISSAPNVEPEGVASREFPTVRRGYDPSIVRRYLAEVAQQLRSWRSREAELLAQLADAERRAKAPLIDVETVSAAVGSETARILHAAHAAATEVLAKAEARVTHITAEAEEDGRELQRRAEAEGSTAVSEARQAATALLEAAKVEGRSMVDEAREVRRRILADLAERRRVLTGQIEQLRAGKDTLSSAVAHVSEAIAGVRARLDGSEDEARAAAETALRRVDSERGEPGPRRTEEERTEKPSATSSPARAEDARTTAPVERSAAHTDESHEPERVDELFAKLRASAPTTETPPARRARRKRGAPGATTATAVVDDANEDAIELAEASEDVAAESEASAEFSDRGTILARRAELIGSVQDEVVHALKRALRVEQNELLDRLRSLPRGADPLTALPAEKAANELAEATKAGLVVAYEAGLRFAHERLGAGVEANGSSPRDPVVVHAAAESVATGLGNEVAAAIVRRLDEGIHGPSSDSGSLQHAVGAAYREWKGERVEDVAADHVTSAFAKGVLDAAERAGATVTWIADDGPSRCSDCEDDELTGALAAGSVFPTGQAHPPAHGGCRCVLAPSRS